MAITYTWKITSVKTKDYNGTPDVIVQTYWEKIGTDENGNTGRFSGATPFTSTNVPNGNFVPFDQLTEEVVLSWIKSVVVGDYERHVNEQIAKQLDTNIPVEKPLPWVASSNTETVGTASEVPNAEPVVEPVVTPTANTVSSEV